MGRYYDLPNNWKIDLRDFARIPRRDIRIGQRVWDNDRKIFSIVADTCSNHSELLLSLGNGNDVELCFEENKNLVYNQKVKHIFDSVDIMPDEQYIVRYYSPRYGEILLNKKEYKYYCVPQK